MSENVRSFGYMGAVVKPIPSDDYEEVAERLDDAKSDLNINYEGTLVYSDKNKLAGYSARTEYGGLTLGADSSYGTPEEFVAEAKAAGLEVDPITVVPYNCIWYNGADSDMSMLEAAEFLSRTKKP